MEVFNYTVEPETCFYRTVEDKPPVKGAANAAAKGMFTELERVLNAQGPKSDLEFRRQQVWLRGESDKTKTRIRPPVTTKRLRKLQVRPPILSFFDNIIFMPFYGFDRACARPLRATAMALIVLTAFTLAQEIFSASKNSPEIVKAQQQLIKTLKDFGLCLKCGQFSLTS